MAVLPAPMTSRSIIIAVLAAAVVTVIWEFLEHALVDDFGLPHAPLIFLVALIPALVVAMSSRTASAPRAEAARRKPAATEPPSEQAAPIDGPRERGHVKWFNRTKGFGFIVCDNGDEIFVHHRSIRGEPRQSLDDGEPVEFVIVEHPKGLQAEDVTRAES